MNFRVISPRRTCQKTYANYGSYKMYLRQDFNCRCGYTDCSDFWFGGQGCFHIDHFIPWKNHLSTRPSLKTDYSNLVYSCSHVNILKSNDEGNYLDPCNEDFNLHFGRDSLGNIYPKADSLKARYMYNRLKLYMRRYQIIWMLEQLECRIKRLKSIDPNHINPDINTLYIALTDEFMNYIEYLKAN